MLKSQNGGSFRVADDGRRPNGVLGRYISCFTSVACAEAVDEASRDLSDFPLSGTNLPPSPPPCTARECPWELRLAHQDCHPSVKGSKGWPTRYRQALFSSSFSRREMMFSSSLFQLAQMSAPPEGLFCSSCRLLVADATANRIHGGNASGRKETEPRRLPASRRPSLLEHPNAALEFQITTMTQCVSMVASTGRRTRRKRAQQARGT